jgi:Zn ribbon nucleic-acid-binding protein
MARIGQLTSQIVSGNCPECRTDTLLVSFEPNLYRCVNCGYDLEQKINGVIKYVIANEQTQFKASVLPDEEEHG